MFANYVFASNEDQRVYTLTSESQPWESFNVPTSYIFEKQRPMRPKGKLRFHPYASKKTSPFKHMDGKRSSKGQRLYHCATPESFRAYYAKEPCPKNSSEDTLEKEEKNELYKMEVRFMLNKDE